MLQVMTLDMPFLSLNPVDFSHELLAKPIAEFLPEEEDQWSRVLGRIDSICNSTPKAKVEFLSTLKRVGSG